MVDFFILHLIYEIGTVEYNAIKEEINSIFEQMILERISVRMDDEGL